jgi:dihydrolipoamide dehydrogenase
LKLLTKNYAIGDVVGNPMLAHKASAKEKLRLKQLQMDTKLLLNRMQFRRSYLPIPNCLGGFNRTEAKEKEIKYEVAKFPWGASGRATTIDRNEGLTNFKLILKPNVF